MDRLLGVLVRKLFRRARSGDPLWLVLAVSLWVFRRARRRPPSLVWRTRLDPGERLVISSLDPRAHTGSGD